MSHVPDLVRDSKLETHFRKKYTKHRFHESDPTRGERAIVREEYWTRGKYIGGGGYSRVWLEQCVKGVKDQNVRAVKQILKPQQSGDDMDCNRELEAMAKFSHDRYVRCFIKSTGWFEDDYHLYVAMEYLPHGDLHNYTSNLGPLPELEVQVIAYQLLEGLNFLHGNGFAHRDLKPSNILIKSKPPEPWWVKIGDFGISKRVENSTSRPSTIKGTLAFMPPEHHGFVKKADCCEGDPSASRAADMWSLGEVIFQLLTKKPTFENTAFLYAFVQGSCPFPVAALQQKTTNPECINLLQSMMRASPIQRVHVDQALSHPWTAALRVPSPKAASILSLSSSEVEDDFELASIGKRFEPSAAWNAATGNSDPRASSTVSEPAHLRTPFIIPSRDLSSNLSSLTISEIQTTNNASVSYSMHDDALEKSEASETRIRTTQMNERRIDSDSPCFEALQPSKQAFREGYSAPRMWTLQVKYPHIFSMAFSPNGELFASGDDDGKVWVWEVSSGHQIQTLEGRGCPVYSIAFSPNGTLLVVGQYRTYSVQLWKVSTGRCVRTLEVDSPTIATLAFSPDGELLALRDSGKRIGIYEISTGHQIHNFEVRTSWAYSLKFSPDGKLLASRGDDRKIRLWEVSSGCQVKIFGRHSYGVVSIAFSPDSELLAIGDYMGQIWLCEMSSGRQVHVLQGISNSISSITFSPDGKLLASGGVQDRMIRLWEVSTGRQVQTFEVHGFNFKLLAFSPDNKLLASEIANEEIKLWEPRQCYSIAKD